MDLLSLQAILPEYAISENHGMLIVTSAVESLSNLIEQLKSKVHIELLMDLTCVHYPGRALCFCLVYNFLSISENARVMVHVNLGNKDKADSVYLHFAGSVWYEREIYDMYGVKFNNCPDHRRILMDEDFEGHPLTKHFPLVGYVEPRYDVNEQRVVDMKVDLAQDYREFTNITPWLGTEYKKEQE